MKRLGLFVCIVLFAVGLFGAPSSTPVFAQEFISPDEQVAGGNIVDTKSEILNAEAVGAKSSAAAPKDPPSVGCSIFGKSPISDCLSAGVQWLIKNTLLEIAGFLLWLTANMFNYAVQIGVLDFKGWAPDELYPIWLIIRQIISLFIVFIGLYLGLMYILGKDEKFQKYIPWVIMFALFVNFSYPLVRTAVDISNVVSLNIYASAVGADALNPGSEANAGSLIVGKLGLQGLASSAVASQQGTTADGKKGMLGSIDSIPGALLAVCYVLYAAYIFFMVTALFVMRTAALVFLIVASPLLLVDSVFPMLGEKAKMLRKILFEQLAVAPIFMIMLALTLKFLDVFNTTGKLSATQFGSNISGADVSGAVNNPTIVTFFNILMMLIMLWIMLKVTKSAAGSLGEYATSAMGTVGGFALGAAAGGTGLLARKGLGGLAAKARDSKWVSNPDSFMARRAYSLTNSMANSTFDLRNSTIAQKYSGKIGMSMGMGAKMGYDEESKKKVALLSARAARIKTKYERDLVKDGKVIARKGDVDVEGVAAKERFYQNNGGAIFLTQKQQEELNSSFIDESSSKDMSDYKKLTSKSAKSDFTRELNIQLEKITKDEGGTTSPRAQALMRTLYDIKKQEEDEKKAFEQQLEQNIDRYNRTTPDKRKNYLAQLDKEMYKAVTSSIDPLTDKASVERYTRAQAPTPIRIDQALQQAQIPLINGTSIPSPSTNKPKNTETSNIKPEGSLEFDQRVYSKDELKTIGEEYSGSVGKATPGEPNALILESNSQTTTNVVKQQSGATSVNTPFDVTTTDITARLKQIAKKKVAAKQAVDDSFAKNSPTSTATVTGTQALSTSQQPVTANVTTFTQGAANDVTFKQPEPELHG